MDHKLPGTHADAGPAWAIQNHVPSFDYVLSCPCLDDFSEADRAFTI